MSAKRTYILTRSQCEQIAENDKTYIHNAQSLLYNTQQVVPLKPGESTSTPIRYTYPSWVKAQLDRLKANAVRRWELAHPLPKTVIAVAFDKAERRAA